MGWLYHVRINPPYVRSDPGPNLVKLTSLSMCFCMSNDRSN